MLRSEQEARAARCCGPMGISRTGHCIASDCMAWRFAHEYRCTDPGAAPEGEGWQKDGPVVDETDFGEAPGRAARYQPWRRTTRGYCGLAGKPDE